MESEKEISITNDDGTTSKYTIRKFRAIAGREIVLGYPLSSLPRVGDYKKNEALMFKLLETVSVKIGEQDLFLETPALVDNHVKNWNSLVQLEWEVLKFNCSFLNDPEKAVGLADIIKSSLRDFLVEVFLEAQAKS